MWGLVASCSQTMTPRCQATRVLSSAQLTGTSKTALVPGTSSYTRLSNGSLHEAAGNGKNGAGLSSLVSSQGNGRSHQELVAASSHVSEPEEITLTSQRTQGASGTPRNDSRS